MTKPGALIEAAGLKGKRIGNATISTQHANFFINTGQTRAEDMTCADRTGAENRL